MTIRGKVSRSFTLIELTITLSILLFVGGLCSVKLGGLMREYLFSTQTKHLNRVLQRAYKMAYFLETEITVDIVMKEGCLVKVSSNEDEIQAMIGQEKKYSFIKFMKIDEAITERLSFVFSKKKTGDFKIIEVLSEKINTGNKVKKIKIRGKIIKKHKKFLTM